VSVQRLFGKLITVGRQDTLVWTKQWQYHKNIFIGRSFDKMSASISYHAPLPNPPLRNMGYTPLYLLSIGLGSPSPWITCPIFLQPSMRMIVSSWSLIDSLRWQIWDHARRALQSRPPLTSSLKLFGIILGSHLPLFQIETIGS
jgi:hypothetical protein